MAVDEGPEYGIPCTIYRLEALRGLPMSPEPVDYSINIGTDGQDLFELVPFVAAMLADLGPLILEIDVAGPIVTLRCDEPLPEDKLTVLKDYIKMYGDKYTAENF
jgi:hypothetical protein